MTSYIQQSGQVTPLHLTAWTYAGAVQDAGPNLFLSYGTSGLVLNAMAPVLNYPLITGGLQLGNYTLTFPATAGTSGQVLTTDGTGNTYWSTISAGSGTVTSVSFTGGLISVANPTTAAALTVAGTSGGIPYFSSSSTWASSAALTANQLVVGGGAGAAPFTLAAGTNGYVLTMVSGSPAWAAPSGSSGLTVGTTTISSGTNGYILYDNAGVLGNLGTTGSGNVVLATSPTLITPNLDVASATSYTATVSITGSATTGAFNYGTLGFSDVGLFGEFTVSFNTYAQMVVQNTNSGTGASADYIVANNNSTATTYYGDFGINSSGFTGTGSLALPNATYLYAANGDLALGTTTSNAIHFVVNNGASDAMTISSAGVVSFGTPLSASSGGTGVANNAANTITFTGNYSLGLTLSGATTLTLPTTGTLATTSNTVASFSAGTTGFTPNTATTGAVTLAGNLSPTNGGTGVANNSANTITFTGNYSLGLTLSGATTLTLPTTGTLAALGTAQTWTAAQSFTASGILLKGSSTGYTTFTSANASATAYTLTFPAVTSTVAVIGLAQTWSAAQSFTASGILLKGSSTGYTTFASANASATSYTLTFPAVNDTVATIGTAQTWTAAQSFTASGILLKGSSTGYTTFASANASATAYTLTFPAVTSTVAVLGTAQTFTAAQSFTASGILLKGSSTGYTTFTSQNASATAYTHTFQAFTGTVDMVASPTSTGAVTTYSQLAGDTTIIFNISASCVVTLLAASSYPGRLLFVTNTAAFAVTSASSNVVPLGSTTAGTAILAATAGKWAILQSNGTNWVIIAGN